MIAMAKAHGAAGGRGTRAERNPGSRSETKRRFQCPPLGPGDRDRGCRSASSMPGGQPTRGRPARRAHEEAKGWQAPPRPASRAAPPRIPVIERLPRPRQARRRLASRAWARRCSPAPKPISIRSPLHRCAAKSGTPRLERAARKGEAMVRARSGRTAAPPGGRGRGGRPNRPGTERRTGRTERPFSKNTRWKPSHPSALPRLAVLPRRGRGAFPPVIRRVGVEGATNVCARTGRDGALGGGDQEPSDVRGPWWLAGRPRRHRMKPAPSSPVTGPKMT